MTEEPARPTALSRTQFRELYEQLKGAAVWGPNDRRGALNNLEPTQVLAAAGEVRSGRSVSLAAPIGSEATADDPEPAGHRMTGPTGDETRAPGLQFAADRL